MFNQNLPKLNSSKKKIITILWGSIAFAVVLSLWSILSYGNIVEPIFLPTPDSVIITTLDLFKNHNFIFDITASTVRVTIGFLISAVIAIPLGILMGSSNKWNAAFSPIIGFIRYMPAAAFIPLLILWLGIGLSQKVAIIFISIFFYLVILIADGAKQTFIELKDAAYILGANKKDIIVKVVFPFSLPNIINSLRTMMGVGWTMIIVAEMVSADKGIGAMIIQAQRFLQTPKIIGGIIVIGLIGVVFDLIFKLLYHILIKWRF